VVGILVVVLTLGLFVLPYSMMWWTVDVTVLALVVLVLTARLGMLVSSFAGRVGRGLARVRSMRGSSLVFISLLSSDVIAALATFDVAASVAQVWMFVAVAPDGLELWTDPRTGAPAYTIGWSSIKALRGSSEMLGARYRSDADETPSIDATVDGPGGPVTFSLGIFDDRQYPARSALLSQVGDALRLYRPRPHAAP
jgi:hypothetical protein